MAELLGKMIWYPGDAVIPIKEDDLKSISKKHGVRLSLHKTIGETQRVLPGGVVVEGSLGMPFDAVTHSVVAIEADDEASFRRCVRELIDTYRGPVPMWGMWGSTKRAESIINELLDQNDCWS